jgi:hypothetical protein
VARKTRQVELSCVFDRLGEQKLTQVYRLLVPGATSHDYILVSPEQQIDYENSSDLCPGFFRAAKGKQDD